MRLKGKNGYINIKFSKINDNYTLQVKDDGIGLPKSIDFKNTSILGLKLVNALVDQLDGTIEVIRNNGTEFIIK